MIDFWTGRAGRLDEVDVLLADVVQDLDEDVLVGELEDLAPTELTSQVAADLAREVRVGVAGVEASTPRPAARRRPYRRRSRGRPLPPSPSRHLMFRPGCPRPSGAPLSSIARCSASPARKTAMPATASPSLRRMTMTPRALLPYRLIALDVGAHDLAAGADEQQLLVRLGDQLDRGHVAGLGALERDEPDALAAAVLGPELRRAGRACRSRSRSARGCRPRAARRPCPRPGRPARASRMPMTPAASRPIARTSRSWKRAILPRAVASTMSSSPGRDADPGQRVVLGHGDGPDARRAHPLELLDGRLLDDALGGSP